MKNREKICFVSSTLSTEKSSSNLYERESDSLHIPSPELECETNRILSLLLWIIINIIHTLLGPSGPIYR